MPRRDWESIGWLADRVGRVRLGRAAGARRPGRLARLRARFLREVVEMAAVEADDNVRRPRLGRPAADPLDAPRCRSCWWSMISRTKSCASRAGAARRGADRTSGSSGGRSNVIPTPQYTTDRRESR